MNSVMSGSLMDIKMRFGGGIGQSFSNDRGYEKEQRPPAARGGGETVS